MVDKQDLYDIFAYAEAAHEGDLLTEYFIDAISNGVIKSVIHHGSPRRGALVLTRKDAVAL
jgi:hypothetical protein